MSKDTDLSADVGDTTGDPPSGRELRAAVRAKAAARETKKAARKQRAREGRGLKASMWFTGSAIIFTVTSALSAIGVVLAAIQIVAGISKEAERTQGLYVLSIVLPGLGLSMFLAGASWRLRRTP